MLELLLGGKTAEMVLLYIQNYGDAYASAIAETFGAPLSIVQRQLRKFEMAGILVSQMKGKTRVYYWNPRYPLQIELQAFLKKALSLLPESEQREYFRRRMRPRRTGKPL